MLLVTVYPILYAIVLSVQKVDLRFPDESGFVGLDNYAAVLTSPLWWQDVFNTTFVDGHLGRRSSSCSAWRSRSSCTARSSAAG